MKDLLKTIWKILRYIDKLFSLLRNAVLNIMLFCLLVFIVIIVTQTKDTDTTPTEIPKGSILKLSITGSLVEQRRFPQPLEELLEDLDDTPKRETCMQDILDAIHYAEHDQQITTILLDTSKMTNAGINQLTTIGNALLNFRHAGKKVIAAADHYPQGQYFLATYADRIFLNPMGRVDLHGMGRYSLYFKDAIDKLHIDYNIFKVGAFKSATEPYSRNSMSEADKEQSRLWLTALWNEFSSRITQNRKLQQSIIHHYVNNPAEELKKAKGNSAKMALDTGLVDALYTRQQVRDYLHKLSGKTGTSKLHYISVQEYLDNERLPRSYSSGNGNIAVIVAEGIIIDGKQKNGTIGGDSLARRIRQAKEDKEVKALVLRINSGGGSAFASEIIRQELLDFKRAGKKLVVSMGTIAASGGYWIAANADQIWAAPSTLTGSIGVFGALPTFQHTLSNLGIHSDGISTAPQVQSNVPLQALRPAAKSVLQQSVEHTYRTFIDIVAQGRKMEHKKVEQLAQGRVYDAVYAKEIGLVDKLGNLSQAITAAGKLSDIQKPQPFYIRPHQTFRQQLLEFFNSVRMQISVAMLPLFMQEELKTISQEIENSTDFLLFSKTMIDRNAVYSYTPPLLSQSFL